MSISFGGQPLISVMSSHGKSELEETNELHVSHKKWREYRKYLNERGMHLNSPRVFRETMDVYITAPLEEFFLPDWFQTVAIRFRSQTKT